MHITAEEEDNGKKAHVRGPSTSSDLCPAESVIFVVLRNRSGVFQNGNNIFAFFLCQETCLFR